MEYPFVNIHTHKHTGEGIEMLSSMALSGALPASPCSLGVHPWQVGEIDIEAALHEVETAPINAIGEIGLDHSRPIPQLLQAEVFEAQLTIAERRRLPVVLHCVKAFEPVMEILARYRLPGVIFHGFVGSEQQAARAVGAGHYLSFGERSLGSPKTLEAMKSVPLSGMFLETDEGELSITDTYRRTAGILGVGEDELRKNIFDNYTKIFGE